MEKLGLYIHIPFCEKKCRYCGFLSFADYDDDAYETYVDALCKELKGYNEGFAAMYSPDTIFMGGGTPSLLSPDRVRRIFSAIHQTFAVEGGAEITIESNPNSLTAEKLAVYREVGINRLSMGAQSMNDCILDALGRVHRSADVKRAFTMAREEGFDNINIDLMFGVPEQSLDDVLDSVREVIEMGPEHISLYSLQLEEDTIFYEEYKSGMLDVPSEEKEREMYHEAIKRLKAAGYEHYEISNFAKPGFECRHNLKYWNLEDYLGAGLGAHSHIKGDRRKNVDSMVDYIELLSSGENAIEKKTHRVDNREDAMAIFVFTALRKTEGIDTIKFEETFGEAFFTVYREKADLIKKWIDDGLMIISGSNIALTEKGIDVSNDIMSEFV